MLTRFIDDHGSIFRVLAENEAGAWVIDHARPGAPTFIDGNNYQILSRIPMPDSFGLDVIPATAAQRKRIEMIQPLLDDEECVRDRFHRSVVAKLCATEHGTSEKRILRLYYHFLATGRVMEPRKKRLPRRREEFDWAIRTFYFSAKGFSLKGAYEMMVVERYALPDGTLPPDVPTFESFRHYFYKHDFHKQPQKIIAREGLTAYQRDHRPAYGSAMGWALKPGFKFLMDATLADIYLVSRDDRSAVIGRPTVYLAVDAATQLICGVYVGLESDSSAVIRCLANAAEDKVSFCAAYGIPITEADWPCQGLPETIVTDNGREFIGARAQELCRRYGLEIESLPPFRADLKGLVEKSFDLLQQRYKPLLRGKGVIEEDAQERWSVDYRNQAALDLEQFTQVILYAVLYLNSGRCLSDGRTPAQHWTDAAPQLLEIDVDKFRRLALPRTKVTLTRKGFRVNALTYVPETMEGLFLQDAYEVAFDLSDLSKIYLVLKDGWVCCPLSDTDARFSGLSIQEAEERRRVLREQKAVAKAHELAASTATAQNIRAIADSAQSGCGSPVKTQSGQMIKENREMEGGKLT